MGLFGPDPVFAPASAGLSPKGWILAGGLLLPIPVLVTLTFYALFQGERLLPGSNDLASVYRIEANARQWQWEFRYLDEPGAPATLGVLHIPAGRPVEVVTTSEDVIHSFWVPRLGGKIDATPGHAARIRISADLPGTFRQVCAEYCETGHCALRFRSKHMKMADFKGRWVGKEGLHNERHRRARSREQNLHKALKSRRGARNRASARLAAVTTTTKPHRQALHRLPRRRMFFANRAACWRC